MRAGVIGVLLGRSVCHRCDTGERTLAIGPCAYARMTVTHVCVSGAPPADGRAVQMWIVLCVMVVLPGRLWAIKKGGLADRPRLRNRGVRLVLSARTSRRGWCDRFHAGSTARGRTRPPASCALRSLRLRGRVSVRSRSLEVTPACGSRVTQRPANCKENSPSSWIPSRRRRPRARLGRAALPGACTLLFGGAISRISDAGAHPSPEKNITIFTTLVKVVRSAQPPPQRPSKEPRIT